ncbi:hypothetical protein GCM10027176_72620 [Actinoallomurus bryophytorum]
MVAGVAGVQAVEERSPGEAPAGAGNGGCSPDRQVSSGGPKMVTPAASQATWSPMCPGCRRWRGAAGEVPAGAGNGGCSPEHRPGRQVSSSSPKMVTPAASQAT